MVARGAAALAVLMALSILSMAVVTSATGPSKPTEVDPSGFHPVALPPVRPPEDPLGGNDQRRGLPASTPVPTMSMEPDDQVAVRSRRVPSREPGMVNVPASPAPTHVPKVRAGATPQPPSGGRHRVSGTPTWYCNQRDSDYVRSRCTRGFPDVAGGQFYAAAGPSLRVGSWRGRVVSVSANGKTIKVKLVDFCACKAPHFIDLYLDAFKALGNPRRATVTW